MTESLLLRDSSGSALARTLLRSAMLDVPRAQSRHKALAAVGVAMSMLTSAGSAAAGAAGVTTISILKSLGVGLFMGTLTAGAATQITKSLSAPQAAPSTVQALAVAAKVEPQKLAPQPTAQAVAEPLPETDPAPASSTRAVRKSSAAPSTSEERALIEDARRALTGKRPALVQWGMDPKVETRISQPALAIALLRHYEEQHPNRSLGPDATVVRIEALTLSGNREDAMALAERFVAEHPTHPSVVRVRALVGMR